MDEMLNKLNAALDKYDQKQTNIKNTEARKKTEHEMYLEHFKGKCNEVIRPTMEELGEIIKNRGHKYIISQRDEGKDGEGRTIGVNIQMDILPDGKAKDHINLNNPHLSFVAGTYDNKTWAHVSTMMPGRGGTSGKNGDYELDEITKEVIQKEIIELISKCFGQ